MLRRLFIFELTTFLSLGVVGLIPLAELRASPLISNADGPSMSPPSPNLERAIAVVQPNFECVLFRLPRQKKRLDDGVVGPAWGMLYLIVIAALYLNSFEWVERTYIYF